MVRGLSPREQGREEVLEVGDFRRLQDFRICVPCEGGGSIWRRLLQETPREWLLRLPNAAVVSCDDK